MEQWLLPAALLLSFYAGVRCALARRSGWRSAFICGAIALLIPAEDAITRYRANQRERYDFRHSPPPLIDFPEGSVQGTRSPDRKQITFALKDGRSYTIAEPAIDWTYSKLAWQRAGFTLGLGLAAHLITRLTRKAPDGRTAN